ncbi:MAG: hypothetical protein ACYTGJ_02240 [Planctomycetota bacterium]
MSQPREQRTPWVGGCRAARGLPLLLLLPVLLASCSHPDGEGSGPALALDRGTVHIEIREMMSGEAPPRNIAQELVGRSFLQHGFRLASPEEARYLVRGVLDCVYHKELTIELEGVSTTLEHQWDSTFNLEIVDREQGSGGEPVVKTFSFPEPLRNGRTDDELARRDIRRRAASMMLGMVWRDPELGDPPVAQLISALVDPFEPRTFNELERALVELGPRAVPFLLESLSDTRTVGPEGEYPDLAAFNRDQLKVYHLADRVLAEVLLRYPALDLLSTNDRRFKVIIGWTWAWEDAIGIPDPYRLEPSKRTTRVPDSVQ